MKIGILGGTFNPVHTGHLLMAEGVKAAQKLDRIIFMPCALPPHKHSVRLAGGKHRVKMIKLAVKGNPCFDVSEIELKRGGKSYSVDTLEELAEGCKKNTRFFFIIGSDNLQSFDKWKSPSRLLELCKIIVVGRPGYKFPKRKHKNIIFVNIPTLPVSSTDIRTYIKQNRSIKYLVLDPVQDYIHKNRLYR